MKRIRSKNSIVNVICNHRQNLHIEARQDKPPAAAQNDVSLDLFCKSRNKDNRDVPNRHNSQEKVIHNPKTHPTIQWAHKQDICRNVKENESDCKVGEASPIMLVSIGIKDKHLSANIVPVPAQTGENHDA
jgi:hypothetical protein